VESGGTNIEKLRFITKETYQQFKEARDNNKIVHDNDIRKWSLEIARQVSYDTFRASVSWVQKFKKKFKIVSRKITKFVTRKYPSE